MDDQTLHHFMQDLLPMIVLPILTVACAWIISLIIAAFRHRASLRAQTEFHNRMIEKFGSADDFSVFIKSEAGKSFFDNLTVEPAAPLTKILSSIKIGTILTLLGVGFFILSINSKTDDAANALFIICTVTFTVGIGFLVSSAISYRLAKTWGIISVANKQTSGQPSSTVA